MKFSEAKSSKVQQPIGLEESLVTFFSEKYNKLKREFKDVCQIKDGKALNSDRKNAEVYAEKLDQLLFEMGMKEPSFSIHKVLKLGIEVALELESLFGDDSFSDNDPRVEFGAKNKYKGQGRFALEMRGLNLFWNPTASKYAVEDASLPETHSGLINYNLVCYANAALQALASQSFIENLEEIQERCVVSKNSEEGTAYLKNTEASRKKCLEVLKRLVENKGAFSARDLFKQVGFSQAFQDMDEFVTYLFDAIGFKQVVSCETLSDSISGKQNIKPQERHGTISLPINPKIQSVQGAIDIYFGLDSLEIPTEDGHTHKKTSLVDAPNILPLVLKRYGPNRSKKVALDQEVIITLKDEEKATYTLQSIACHLSFGHYVAGCRYQNKKNPPQWFEHNDQQTTFIGADIQHWNRNPEQNAYLIVYHKK